MSKIAKPWKLTEDESFSSYRAWQHNMIYTLSQDSAFAPFLKGNITWAKLTATAPHRGLQDDTTGDRKLSKEEKVQNLNAMLRYITQWSPHYLANDIERNSTSIDSVWHFIRKYYSFQQSEAQFIKLCSIKMEENERPERLYQRILAHIQDNLLKRDGKLKYEGNEVTEDEDISPTVERMAVLRWMEVIDPDLPAYVARAFAHDLQNMTLKDLQPQIVDALDSFLEEIRSKRVSCSAARSFTPGNSRNKSYNRSFPRKTYYQPQRSATSSKITKTCRICKAEGRQFMNHSIATCDYLSQAEKRDLIQSCRVDVENTEIQMPNNESYDEMTEELHPDFDPDHQE